MCSFVAYIFHMYNNLHFTVNGQPLMKEPGLVNQTGKVIFLPLLNRAS